MVPVLSDTFVSISTKYFIFKALKYKLGTVTIDDIITYLTLISQSQMSLSSGINYNFTLKKLNMITRNIRY